jgi:ABC-type transport system involved in multi-copper enzyme maturation permease subunit
MIWLTWRQFRGGAAMMAAALAALAAILALTGPGLADDYSSGIATCTTQSGGCSDFVQEFFNDHQIQFLAVTAVVLVLPALIGLFWGAPLIARELEAGTHRLIWSQSITRTRWLAVKLGLTGLAAMAAAGLGSLAVTWWASPIDKTAGPGYLALTAASNNLPRLHPLLFAARGIVPIGYAAFAFALAVTVGMLVRRTLPAMAITLAVFVGAQIAMPLLVRPHLLPPTHSTIEITESSLDSFNVRGDRVAVSVSGNLPDAWVLSSHSVDPSGHTVDPIAVSASSGPCAPLTSPPEEATGKPDLDNDPNFAACLAEITRLGYRQQVTYQPSSRYWPFQWYETGIYTTLAVGLAGFCFWRIRRLPS